MIEKTCVNCEFEPNWGMYEGGFCKFDKTQLKIPAAMVLKDCWVDKTSVVNCPTFKEK